MEDKMKKLIALICAMALCLSLAACGGNEEGENSNSGGNILTNDDTIADADFAAGTWSESMQSIKEAVVGALGDDYWPNMMVDPDILEMVYGIGADLYDDYYVEVPMISTNVDTVFVIKAKMDKVADVEDVLNTYRDGLIASTMQYPQNLGKIQASVIKTFGNYVCFVQLGGDVMDLMDQGEDVVITHCQDQNKIALDAIEGIVVQ